MNKYGLVAVVGKAHYQLLDISPSNNGEYFNNKEDADTAKHTIYNDINNLSLTEGYRCKTAFIGTTVKYVNREAFLDGGKYDVLHIRTFDKIYTNKKREVGNIVSAK